MSCVTSKISPKREWAKIWTRINANWFGGFTLGYSWLWLNVWWNWAVQTFVVYPHNSHRISPSSGMILDFKQNSVRWLLFPFNEDNLWWQHLMSVFITHRMKNSLEACTFLTFYILAHPKWECPSHHTKYTVNDVIKMH